MRRYDREWLFENNKLIQGHGIRFAVLPDLERSVRDRLSISSDIPMDLPDLLQFSIQAQHDHDRNLAVFELVQAILSRLQAPIIRKIEGLQSKGSHPQSGICLGIGSGQFHCNRNFFSNLGEHPTHYHWPILKQPESLWDV